MTECSKKCGQPATRRGMCHRHYEQHRNRQKAYGRWESRRVDAEPARLHVKALLATGMGKRRVAELAGTNRNNIQYLIGGRPHRGYGPTQLIARDVAERLLEIPLPHCPHQLARGGQFVPAHGTRRRLQALVAIGYTQSYLSRRLGMEPTNGCRLFHTYRQQTVVASTARAAENLFAELQLTTGPSERARRAAKANNWAPPLAWDEDTIDDPSARPNIGERLSIKFDEQYREMREDLGLSDSEIVRRLGIKAASVERQLERYDIAISRELRDLVTAEGRGVAP